MKAFFYSMMSLCLLLFTHSVAAQYSPSDFSMSPITAATNGECNGAISLVNNRASPITAVWSNGDTELNISNLCPGIYAVTITERNGCSWVLEGEVEGNGGCFLRNMTIEGTTTNYCFPALGEVQLNLPANNRYAYVWDNGGQSPHITGLQPGRYCVTINDTEEAECMAFACFNVADEKCNILTFGGPPVVVNEFSNGPTGVEEFIEILVVGDESCNDVDIRGYILDDNDGTYSSNGPTGTGISPGHVRFTYETVWAAVPVGSLILIYDAQNKNTAIKLEDDPEDANGDQVYVIPSTHRLLETQPLYPNNAQLSTYTIKGSTRSYQPGGDWSTMRLYEYADAIQIRKPDGSYTHGISYGIRQLMSGGPDGLLLVAGNARERVFSFQDGDHRTSKNYLIGSTYKGSETPGAPNNETNARYISGLCSKNPFGKFSTVEINEGSATFHPNPFNNRINVELNWNNSAAVQLRLYDLLGKVVYQQPLVLTKGYNQFRIDLPSGLPSGLFHITICKNEETLIGQKVIRTNTGS